MTTDVFKEPKMKRLHTRNDFEAWSPSKKKKIKENFLQFCDIVLSYTKYETFRHDELRTKNNTSPLDSGGSTAESYTSETTSSVYLNTDDELSPRGLSYRHNFSMSGGIPRHSQLDDPSASPGHDIVVEEDDSYDLITCFCGKPYAGRPMIECSACLTWLHLNCAKVRRNNIPETFICERCSNTTTPSSSSISGKSSNNNNNNKQPHNTVKKKHRKSDGNGSKLTPGKMGKSPRAVNTSPVSVTSPEIVTSGFNSSPPMSQQLTANHNLHSHQYQQQYELVNNVVAPGGSSSTNVNSLYHNPHHHHMSQEQSMVQFSTENVC